jgi:hypothetical protein
MIRKLMSQLGKLRSLMVFPTQRLLTCYLLAKVKGFQF